jgi:hypothetical protein
MDADLYVSGRVLDDMISAFSGFSGQLGHACGDIAAGDGAVSGDDPLAGKVHDFAGSWHYGLTQLGQHGRDCVTMLQKVGSAFDQLDQQLAAQFKPGPGQGS